MNPKGVILHHSAGKDTDEPNWKGIRRYHVEGRGWSDIGYHYVVEKIGDEYAWIDARPDNREGAHAKGNNDYLGVCFVGNFEKYEPEPLLLDKGLELVRKLINRHSFEMSDILIHNEVGSTVCPGTKFPAERFLMLLEEGGSFAQNDPLDGVDVQALITSLNEQNRETILRFFREAQR